MRGIPYKIPLRNHLTHPPTNFPTHLPSLQLTTPIPTKTNHTTTQTEDTPTLLASRARARQSFAQNRRLDVGGEEAASALEHARGVTKVLRENVVQGVKKGEDT